MSTQDSIKLSEIFKSLDVENAERKKMKKKTSLRRTFILLIISLLGTTALIVYAIYNPEDKLIEKLSVIWNIILLLMMYKNDMDDDY
ncbi:hypothetical protein RCL_jg24418.t1 [Rhizophagus clarus]|uniref:Uncharacterized protein n=1 Tax=Rhizophagus clarus TaxID=94130 RepID=A0A8H3R8X8_9GLOM|nr:hypothetical protein RCL_jg24418.t1 [Rhizophagus clarus]